MVQYVMLPAKDEFCRIIPKCVAIFHNGRIVLESSMYMFLIHIYLQIIYKLLQFNHIISVLAPDTLYYNIILCNDINDITI